MDGSDFQLVQKIGEGFYGEVFLARSVLTEDWFAIKRMAKTRPEIDRSAFYSEIKISSKLGYHEGIVDVKGYFESSSHYWMVMEYIEGISLLSLMENRGFEPLQEQEAKDIFIQLVDAIDHAHNQKIAHLDLKLENVLITEDRKTKIIDWGLSTTNVDGCTKICGSPEYASPEMWVRTEPTFDASLADVFSLGVILFGLLFGQFPYSQYHLRLMREGNPVSPPGVDEYDHHVSDQAKRLVLSMVDPDPHTRIHLKDVLFHEWFRNKVQV
jgi:serine/threonine protein kinase